jgi:hypothetical protein
MAHRIELVGQLAELGSNRLALIALGYGEHD